MKLKSCYIKGFGKILDTSYNFNDGLTAFCEDNGYGKSTLVVFIKAMLYGMDTTRSGATDGERMRYLPFSGTDFGGTLEFAAGGKEYRIERIFDRTSAADDKTKLYIDGVATDIPKKTNVGDMLFGTDEESFRRIAFITADDTVISSTAGIRSRLVNLTENGDDVGMDAAIKSLNERKKVCDKAVAAQTETIARLTKEIGECEAIKSGLDARRESLKNLADEYDAAEKRLQEINGKNLLAQKWTVYDGYVAEAERVGAAIKEIADKYPAGLPDKDEASKLTGAAMALAKAKSTLAGEEFSKQKTQRLGELEARFKEGVPDERQFEKATADCARLTRLNIDIEKLNADGDRPLCFTGAVPDKTEAEGYKEKLKALRAARASSVPATPAPTPAPASKGKRVVPIALCAVAAVVLIAAIALMFVNPIVGGILMGLGVLGFVVAGFIYLNGKFGSQPAAAPVAPYSPEAMSLESEIRAYLSRYGYFSNDGVEADYARFMQDLEAHTGAVEYNAARAAQLAEKLQQAAAITDGITSFVRGYGAVNADFSAAIYEIRDAVTEYARLKADKEHYDGVLASANAQNQNWTATMAGITQKYALDMGEDILARATAISDDRRDIDALNASLEKYKKLAEDYLRDNNLTTRPEEGGEDTDALREEIAEKGRAYAALRSSIAADETKAGLAADKQLELAEAKAALDEKAHQRDITIKTIEAIRAADEVLNKRFIDPVSDKFGDYNAKLEKVLDTKIKMDKNFNITFEKLGSFRRDIHLSSGERSLCALCLRLAFIDNMYAGEMPFIVMDDPFAFLDAGNFKKAARLLKELAKDRQILYFSCHDSRNIV